MYLHSPAVLSRFENQQLQLGTSLEFLKTIKNLSEKQLFASCHVPPYAFCHLPHIQTFFIKLLRNLISNFLACFFFKFSQIKWMKTNCFALKPLLKLLIFLLKNHTFS